MRRLLLCLVLGQAWVARADEPRRVRERRPEPVDAPAIRGPAASPTPPVEAVGDDKPGEREFLGCNKYPEGKRFRWSLRGEVGLPELVASLGELSCQPIVVGPGVAARAGKVTIEVPDLLTSPEVYRLFLAALEVLGLTIEHEGKTLKIVDAGRAREVSLLDGAAAPGDQFVTRLYRAERAPLSDLAEAIAKMKSKEGEVAMYAPGGALILTDRASNVRRMEELARTLDVAPAGQRIFTVGVHGSSASELAATVDKILVAGRKPPDGKSATATDVAAVVPVEGARLLAVVATDAGYTRVRQLLARIDPPLDSGDDGHDAQAHVIYLANTNAEDMAATLTSLGLSHASAPRAGGPTGGLPLAGEVRIAADKIANALVVFAAGGDFTMVRDLVGKLDVPRRQVYVEATIFDVSIDKERNLGLTFHQGTQFGGASGTDNVGFVSNGSASLNSLTVNAQTVAGMLGGGGFLAGVLGKSFSVAGMDIPSFGVILQALELSKDIDVLSRPHLLTMDNVKAEISVGQSIPFQTQTLASALAPGALSSTYARQDVSLKLDLTPHLNDSDAVRLEIDGTIEDVAGGTATQAGGPTTDKRTIKTAVVVKDGETVVLGGLQKDSESESVSKIPGLGDIPLIGRLFQFKAKQHTKQDLLIVLTPHVIRGPDDLRRIFQQRADERREFIERCTAFSDDSAYEAHVDYKTRRGLLQEINLAAVEAEHEAQAVRAAARALRRVQPDGPIDDPPTS